MFFFVPFQEGSSINEAKGKAPSSLPFLLYNPGERIFLMQNNQEEYMELDSPNEDVIARAVISLLGIYYVFHIDYPAPAKGAFLFLQEHLFHDFLQRRPTRYAARLAEFKLSADHD